MCNAVEIDGYSKGPVLASQLDEPPINNHWDARLPSSSLDGPRTKNVKRTSICTWIVQLCD